MTDMVARSAWIDNAHFLVRCLRYRFRTEKLEIKTMMRLRLTGATALDIGCKSAWPLTPHRCTRMTSPHTS
jgi:hypothetical protein